MRFDRVGSGRMYVYDDHHTYAGRVELEHLEFATWGIRVWVARDRHNDPVGTFRTALAATRVLVEECRAREAERILR